jgi:DNA-binding NtrC family response regulator
LKSVLDAARSIDFEHKELALSPDLPDRQDKLLSVALTSHPQILMVCLENGEGPYAKAILDVARRNGRDLPVVVITQASDPEEWRALLALEPDDFLTPPLRPVDVLPRLWRLHPESQGDDAVVAELKEKLGLKQLIGTSPALVAEIRRIPLVARCDATVLLRGETGTGKEMFARAIHHLSGRSAGPFVAVNCGAIPVELIENELFGHEPGAYTGALHPSAGLLRQTDGGSLFLDEVDCLPLLAQVKLLRFLQEKEFRPLGATKPCRTDVRVIAASNNDLEREVKDRRFRQDLYYRLNVIGLALPPLRDRKEDIPLLARHFVAHYAAAFDAPAKGLTSAALHKLLLHDWPGNVRELENVIERSVVLSPQSLLRPGDLQLPGCVTLETEGSFQALKARTIARFERAYIQELLCAHDGNITHAAKAAGKHRRAFWEMMRKYEIAARPQAHL